MWFCRLIDFEQPLIKYYWLRPCQAGMTNENKTAPVEKFASSADTRYLAKPSLLQCCFHYLAGFWQTTWGFGSPRQKALRASQVTYLHCAKLQPLNTLQVQNVLQIEMMFNKVIQSQIQFNTVQDLDLLFFFSWLRGAISCCICLQMGCYISTKILSGEAKKIQKKA